MNIKDKIYNPVLGTLNINSIDYQQFNTIIRKKRAEKRAKIEQYLMFKAPQLYKGKTEWYIEYYYLDAETETYKRYKYRKGLNTKRIKNKPAERLKIANFKMKAINELLLDGFTPNEDYERNVFAGLKLASALNEAYIAKDATYTKHRTKQSIKNIKDKFVEWLVANKLDNINPNEFTIIHAEKYRTHLLKDRGNGNKTVNVNISIVKTLFYKMEDMNYIERNPFDKIKKLKVVEGIKNIPFTEEEMAIIAQKLPDIHLRLWYFSNFIYYCYIRPNAICHLQYKHLDKKSMQITLIGENAKNNKTSVVKIPNLFKAIIEAILQEPHHDDDYIFSESNTLNNGNSPLHRNRVSDLWRVVVKDGLGIKKDQYALKHTGARNFIINGGNLRELQLQMRHSSLTQTEIYIRTLVADELHTINTATQQF